MRNALLTKTIVALLCLSLAGCAAMERNPRAAKGAGIGAVGGAATGAAIGAIVGGGKGAGQGAAIGAVVGLIGGGLVGSYLDKQAEEMEAVLERQDRLERRQDSLDVSMSSDVMFSSGSAQLFPGGRDKLHQFAGVLNRYPRTVVQVVGHTDSKGDEASNLDLSRRRAQAVGDELIASGVSRSRVSVRGLGESSPVNSNDTPEGRMQNRRVEIAVHPDEGLRNEDARGGGGDYEEPR